MEKVSWLKYLLDKLSAGTNWVLQKKIAKRLFLDLQADNPKKPVTNWSPRFMVWVDVIERALELEKTWLIFNERWLLQHQEKPPETLTIQEFVQLRTVLPILKAFQAFFYKLETETESVSSIFLLKALEFVQDKFIPDPMLDSPYVMELKNTFYAEWVKYFALHKRESLLAAAWFDPYWHSRLSTLVSGSKFEVTIAGVEKMICDIALGCYRAALRKGGVAARGFTFTAARNPVEPMLEAIESELNGGAPPLQERPDIERDLAAEMRKFKDSCAAWTHGPTDALQCWKRNANIAPNLARAARVFFAIPVTSAACERTFSASSIIFSPLRRSMGPQTLEALTQTRRRNGKRKRE